MGDESQDLHDALQSSLSWSRDEKSIFLDMLVEEFINKQPEAMDALVALVLFRISKITDQGWNQVAIRFTERTGKTYTMEELKEQMNRFTQPFQYMENLFGQAGPGIHFPHSTFDPCSERKEDTRVFKSPDENVPIHEKDAINSDGCNVGVQYHKDCVRKSNRSSDEGDHCMHFPQTTSKQFFECGNDGGISISPDENFLIPEKEGRNSDECNGNVKHPEESPRSCGNVPYEQSQPGLAFPCATFEPYFEHDNDAGLYWSPDVLHQEDGHGMDSPNATSEPYFEHYDVERVYWSPDENVLYPGDCARNSNRSSGNGSLQDGGPGDNAGIRRSPIETFSVTEKEDIISDGCNVSVSYPYTNSGDSNRSLDNVSHQEGGPIMAFLRSEFELSDEHDNDATCQSPVESVPIPKKDSRNLDGCNGSMPYPEESVRNSSRSCSKVLYPPEDFEDSRVKPNDSYYRRCENGEDNVKDSVINPNIYHRREIENAPEKAGECEGAEASTLAAEINCGNSSNIEQSDKEGGPGTSFPLTEFQPSDGHDSDAGICQSPVESVSIPEKDSSNPEGCNDSVSVIYPEESITNSSRSCNDVLHPQDVEDSGVNPSDSYPRQYDNAEENVKDSGVNEDKYHTRETENATEKARESKGSPSCTLDGERDCRNLSICRNVSSPIVNAEFVSNSYDSASDQEDNVISSTPRYEDYNINKSMLCNKRPAADLLASSDFKINKWSSYSKAENFCLVDENPDDGDSFSFARCRNILHGIRRIDSQFRDTALDFLEDPYYRKFFMQIKYEKRLDWLSSILGIKY